MLETFQNETESAEIIGLYDSPSDEGYLLQMQIDGRTIYKRIRELETMHDINECSECMKELIQGLIDCGNNTYFIEYDDEVWIKRFEESSNLVDELCLESMRLNVSDYIDFTGLNDEGYAMITVYGGILEHFYF